MSKPKLWPRLMLVAATVIWGSSFLFMKQAVSGLPVFFLLAVRFSLAAVVLGLVFCRRWKAMSRRTLVGGVVLGVLEYSAYVLQTYGLSGIGGWRGTTPGKNAFFTAIYCVLVPFLAWIIQKKRPDRYNIIAALLCIAGIGLISLGGGDEGLVGGDLLTMLGGVLFALHILAVPRYAKEGDIFLLTILQFFTMAALAWAGVLFTWNAPWQAIDGGILLRILYLAVFATAVAMLFQNIGQANTPPAAAAVLLSLEAPFGVLFSVLLGPERPTPLMYCGFALIFCAVILSETKLSFLGRRKKVAKGG